MNGWSKYYAEEITTDLYIRNLFGQKDFITVIADSGAKKVLEVGAGTGTLSVFLSNLGMQVVTLDNSPEMLKKAEQAKQKFGGNNQLILGDAFALPFADNSFDLIFHQGLFEHFNNQEIHRLIKEQFRVAPTIIFSVPNNFYPKRDFGNERLLSQSSWKDMLKPYRVLLSRNYSPKFFPKWYLIRPPIQYMAKISRS